jgi:hypothetical protein
VPFTVLSSRTSHRSARSGGAPSQGGAFSLSRGGGRGRVGSVRARSTVLLLRTAVAVIALTGVTVVAVSGNAYAAAKINATDYAVTCGSQVGSSSFVPALAFPGNTSGVETFKIKMTLSDCTAIAPPGSPALKVTKGAATGSLTDDLGNSCDQLVNATLNQGNLPFAGSLKIKWTTSPKLSSGDTILPAPSASMGQIGGGGDSTLTFPGETEGVITGSFASDSASSFDYAVDEQTPGETLNDCGGSGGLKKISTDTGVANLGAPPNSITITPADPTVEYSPAYASESQGDQLVATGSYLGTSVNITQIADWSSSNSAVATLTSPEIGCFVPYEDLDYAYTVEDCTYVNSVPYATPGYTTLSASISGVTGSTPFTIVPQAEITTTSLPDGTVGVPYDQTLSASGGVPPYSWSYDSLPPGLNLNSATGEITGTPTAPGTTDVNFGIQDSLGTISDNYAEIPITIDTP